MGIERKRQIYSDRHKERGRLTHRGTSGNRKIQRIRWMQTGMERAIELIETYFK